MKIKRGKTVKINIYYTYCMLFRFLEWYITFLCIFMKKLLFIMAKCIQEILLKKEKWLQKREKNAAVWYNSCYKEDLFE